LDGAKYPHDWGVSVEICRANDGLWSRLGELAAGIAHRLQAGAVVPVGLGSLKVGFAHINPGQPHGF